MSHLPAHQLTMTVLMTPDTANFAGNVHGGSVLKLLDQVAYACASRYASRYVVTLSVDQVTFRQPIHVAVDDQRKPVPVPPLRPFSEQEKRRYAAAELRKQMRLEMNARVVHQKNQDKPS
eukprot:gene3871-3924_t